ncbi:Uncharacterised protein [Chlamydia trachomatis]|nr:Uncharacterised protein [Chlamydia trachomatis]
MYFSKSESVKLGLLLIKAKNTRLFLFASSVLKIKPLTKAFIISNDFRFSLSFGVFKIVSINKSKNSYEY